MGKSQEGEDYLLGFFGVVVIRLIGRFYQKYDV